MPEKIKCPICKGSKTVEYLVSMHDDETECGICHNCDGSGYINRMTSEEEEDYWHDY